jgi:hypothetical protein
MEEPDSHICFKSLALDLELHLDLCVEDGAKPMTPEEIGEMLTQAIHISLNQIETKH